MFEMGGATNNYPKNSPGSQVTVDSEAWGKTRSNTLFLGGSQLILREDMLQKMIVHIGKQYPPP